MKKYVYTKEVVEKMVQTLYIQVKLITLIVIIVENYDRKNVITHVYIYIYIYMIHEIRDCVYVERVYALERWNDIKYEYVVLCYHERLHGVLE